MSVVDWVVLVATLSLLVGRGLWKGRGSRDVKGFLLADRNMPWYTVALSIMATQASAITFTSTPGQGYADGLRFVQYYFGLPIAMVILCITAVPLFHRLGVYTAYEFLEHRFDLKTRTLTSVMFLLQRGLGAGMTIYAPSLLLSVLMGWDIRWTSAGIGGTIILIMATGGVKAVNWADVQLFAVIMFGMCVAFGAAVVALPEDVSVTDALSIAGVAGRMNAIDLTFDPENRYTLWSGVVGGLFIALAYFGTDQSQVQRYLTGASVTQSRLGLMFNGMAKVPMQFFILLIGVMVFVVYQFDRPPLFFNPVEVERVRAGEYREMYEQAEMAFAQSHEGQQRAYRQYLEAERRGEADAAVEAAILVEQWRSAKASARESATAAIVQTNPQADPSDTNYVFLTFVLTYLPAGLVGLLFACVLAASLTSSSGELSALATASIVDLYRRHWHPEATDKEMLKASRSFMVAWGAYAIFFSQYAVRLGSLIEAVNIIGSLFYGTLLGIFLLAFYIRWVGGTAVFWSAFVGEAAVFACFFWTDISWLWYNVIGCVVVVASATLLQTALRLQRSTEGQEKGRP